MKNKRRRPCHLIDQGKDNQRHGAVAASGNERFLSFYLEKTEKCILRQDTTDTVDPLLSEHVVGDHDSIIEHKPVCERIGVQQKSEYKNKKALQGYIFDKIGRPEC